MNRDENDTMNSDNLPFGQIISTDASQNPRLPRKDGTYTRINPPSSLYCDQNGLCLGVEGDIDPTKTGFYMGMMKLASQLDGFSSTFTSSSPPSPSSRSRNCLLVSVDTTRATTLVKVMPS